MGFPIKSSKKTIFNFYASYSQIFVFAGGLRGFGPKTSKLFRKRGGFGVFFSAIYSQKTGFSRFQKKSSKIPPFLDPPSESVMPASVNLMPATVRFSLRLFLIGFGVHFDRFWGGHWGVFFDRFLVTF